MIQKMQFLRDQQIATPSEQELEDWFQANQDDYREGPRYSFEQVYLGRKVDAEQAAEFAEQSNEGVETTLSPLPLVSVASQFQRVDTAAIETQFGQRFAPQLGELKVGSWAAPVYSGFGAHAVKLNEVIPAINPQLSNPAVRRRVENDVLAELRIKAEVELVEELRQRYAITVVD